MVRTALSAGLATGVLADHLRRHWACGTARYARYTVLSIRFRVSGEKYLESKRAASTTYFQAPGGMRCCDLKIGSGEEVAEKGWLVCIHFEGKWLNGKVIESSYNAGPSPLCIEAGNSPEFPALGEGASLHKVSDNFSRRRATGAHHPAQSNLIGAVSRVRNNLAMSTHRFFQDRGFLYVHTPIITTADCEGAGEMFRISAEKGEEAVESKAATDSEEFFGRAAYLTVSGQLAVENFCCGLGDVYTFGPTFRAESSSTTRHLAEFWMIEPEIAFANLEDDMDCAEAFIRFCVSNVLESCKSDVDFFNLRVDKEIQERLELIASKPFARMSYTEAVEVLQKHIKAGDVKFEFEVEWGKELQTEHEKFLTDVVCKGPCIVYNYPKDCKAFYMRLNEDGKTVAAMDLLCPGIGELVGGSQREERLEVLDDRIAELQSAGLAWGLNRGGKRPNASSSPPSPPHECMRAVDIRPWCELLVVLLSLNVFRGVTAGFSDSCEGRCDVLQTLGLVLTANASAGVGRWVIAVRTTTAATMREQVLWRPLSSGKAENARRPHETFLHYMPDTTVTTITITSTLPPTATPTTLTSTTITTITSTSVTTVTTTTVTTTTVTVSSVTETTTATRTTVTATRTATSTTITTTTVTTLTTTVKPSAKPASQVASFANLLVSEENCQMGLEETKVEVEVGRTTRSALLSLPSAVFAGKLPLWLDFLRYSGLDDFSRANHIALVVPQALPNSDFYGQHRAHQKRPDNKPSFVQVGLHSQREDREGVHDVELTRAVLEQVMRLPCIDVQRIHCTGYSNGARFCIRLASELPGLRYPSPNNASRAIPILAFHGDADPVNLWGGHGLGYWHSSVPASLQRWAKFNRCSLADWPPSFREHQGFAVASQRGGNVVQVTEYEGCQDDATVKLVRLHGAGHQWPSAAFEIPNLGKVARTWVGRATTFWVCAVLVREVEILHLVTFASCFLRQAPAARRMEHLAAENAGRRSHVSRAEQPQVWSSAVGRHCSLGPIARAGSVAPRGRRVAKSCFAAAVTRRRGDRSSDLP
eukprot:s383_g10.t1